MNLLPKTLLHKIIGLLCVSVLFITSIDVQADAGMKATLTSPDLTHFPEIGLSMDVRGPTSGFLSGLQPADVTLIENGVEFHPSELTETHPPLNLSIAIDASTGFAVSNTQTRTRWEVISSALTAWAAGLSADNADDFNIFANGGFQAVQVQPAAKWRETIASLKPDLTPAASGLESVSLALDQAGQIPSKSAILWITGLPEGKAFTGLDDLQKRATQIGACLFIWVVAPSASLQTPAVDALAALATQTGGQAFGFSGEETLPDIGAYFNPLRGLYTLKYTSRASKSGKQTLAVKISSGGQTAESAPFEFQVDIQPPNPVFVSPPETISRTRSANSSDALASLTPKTQDLRVLIDFPDGHSRPLAWLRLYVDGKQTSEITTPPFDHFAWDLSGYTATGQHTLQLEAQDSLGLTQKSVALPVQVVVTVSPANLSSFLSGSRRLITIASLVLVGVFLAVGLFLGFRLLTRRRSNRPGALSAAEKGAEMDATGSQATAHEPGHVSKPLKARLIFIDPNGMATSAAPIQVVPRGMTFGSDPARATCLLDDPSVDALHARLRITPDAEYLLIDEGSAAGTWVNYLPVALAGAVLQHGDIIHMGRVSMRFLLAYPTDLPQARVEPLPEQP